MIYILTVFCLLINVAHAGAGFGDDDTPSLPQKPPQIAPAPIQPPAPPPPAPVMYGPPCSSNKVTANAMTIEKMLEQATGISPAINRTLGNTSDTLTVMAYGSALNQGFGLPDPAKRPGNAFVRLTGSYNVDLPLSMCRQSDGSLLGYITTPMGDQKAIVIQQVTPGKSVQLSSQGAVPKILSVR